MAARLRKHNYNRNRKKIDLETVGNSVSFGIQIAIVVVLAFIVVRFFAVRTTAVGQAMEPGIQNGDQVLVNEFKYLLFAPKQGDVVVFLPNGNERSHDYVRRIAACPGDTVIISEGILKVNGENLPLKGDDQYIAYQGMASTEITLGEEEYFVIGDNINNCEDSRYANIGMVKKKDISGQVWYHFSSLLHQGSVR